MAITTALATSFKQELMVGTHNFTTSSGNAFKIALIKSGMAGTYGVATTNAGTPGTGTPSTSNLGTDEVTGTGYTAGGNTLTNVTPTTSSTTALTDFADSSWTSSTITARGCMIYNSTNSNRCVGVWDFGSDQVSSSGTFTIVFPTADASNAIIRLA
jgi:hypothetical protein